MSVTITISVDLFEHIKKVSSQFEELPEDFNPYDQFGGNMDDSFWGGATYGENELAVQIIGSYEANKVQG
jgi:hypothetical protein